MKFVEHGMGYNFAFRPKAQFGLELVQNRPPSRSDLRVPVVRRNANVSTGMDVAHPLRRVFGRGSCVLSLSRFGEARGARPSTPSLALAAPYCLPAL
jgi:hypothetical protein